MLKNVENLIKKKVKKDSPLYVFLKISNGRFIYILRFLRFLKPVTKLLGRKNKITHDIIEIDITFACTLKCTNCNRFCSTAPTTEAITVPQIQKFITESVKKNTSWRQIKILGGEPTLHPDLMVILDLLINYKEKHSPKTELQLYTNGFTENTKKNSQFR